MTKVYLVKYEYHNYEDSYVNILATFTDNKLAEEHKKYLVRYIKKLDTAIKRADNIREKMLSTPKMDMKKWAEHQEKYGGLRNDFPVGCGSLSNYGEITVEAVDLFDTPTAYKTFNDILKERETTS